ESKKESILELIKNCKTLDREQRKATIAYVNSFYDEINKIRFPEASPSSNVTINP
ncbi:MAG: hypothetical protein ACI8P3_004441, partial [Saprospiraceae bacterium]